MIKIRDLIFEYFDRDDAGHLTEMINAIRGINFDAEKGDFIAIAGKNGSGKSTFARILNRLVVPLEGTVLISGLDAMNEDNVIEIRKKVGMVFQNPSNQIIFPQVYDDIKFSLDNMNVPKEQIPKRIEEALEMVGMKAFMYANPYELLSGGCLLMTAVDGQRLADALMAERIPAVVVGRIVEGKGRILQNGEEIRYLDRPKQDQVYKAQQYNA